jgi:putative salt-induced outer membrane protein YdiY
MKGGLEMHRLLYLILFGVMLFPGVASADEVFLTNGDRYSGTILQLTDGKLVFVSDAAGEVTLKQGDIQSFSSMGLVEIHLKDGTVLNQEVQVGQSGTFAIENGVTLRAQIFQLADIASINPPPKPKPKWTGSLSAGFTATSGNTSTEAINASFSVGRRSEKDRTTASADYAKGKQENPDTGEENTTEDWWRAKAQYDYFFSKKFFGFINGGYEKDSIAELDRRVVVGGGAGYQWLESERTSFSTSLGLASLYEKFENSTDSNSEMSAQAGYNLNHQLNKSVKFLHDLTYYPALDKVSDYYLTTTAELRASLTTTMFANFKTIFNYDATPAPGRSSTDVKYIFGIGMTF